MSRSALGTILGLLLLSSPAGASVEQPGGTAIPRLPSMAERNLVTSSWAYNATTQSYSSPEGGVLSEPLVFGSYYSPPTFPQFVNDDAITLAGLFKWRRETIDWKADATSPAGAFVPGCTITLELVLHGGGCEAPLGWYNVPDPSARQAPDATEIYQVTPFATDVASWLDCRAPLTEGFCPLAWDNRQPRDLAKLAWVPSPVTFDVRTDPRYQGGAIGFVWMMDSKSGYACGGPRYSVREQNARNSADEPFVGAVVYRSTQDAGAIYLAFDEGVLKPADWTNQGMTDGDYNDYVAFISGCFEGTAEGGAAGAGSGGDSTNAVGGGSDDAGGAGERGLAGEPNQAGTTSSGGTAQMGTDNGGTATSRGGDSSNRAGSGGSGTSGSAPSGGVRNEGGAPATRDEGSAGCGCRLTRSAPSGAELLLAMIGAAAAWRRRARHRTVSGR